jgi:hypothetical protein
VGARSSIRWNLRFRPWGQLRVVAPERVTRVDREMPASARAYRGTEGPYPGMRLKLFTCSECKRTIAGEPYR